jgi:hypothetical protein
MSAATGFGVVVDLAHVPFILDGYAPSRSSVASAALLSTAVAPIFLYFIS